MHVINNYFQLLYNGQLQENQRNKLIFSVKYYLSRACRTVRDPRIIQLNHYIDDIFSSNKNSYKHIVLSPSGVPLPIAYLLNFSLIKNDDSKFFFVNNERIKIHPYEYIIPAFIALFSGNDTNFAGKKEKKMFLICILLSGELAMKLAESKLLELKESIGAAVILVMACVWNLSRESVGFVLDELFSGGLLGDLQTCLQTIGVTSFSPSYFLDDYSVSQISSSIMASAEQSIVSNTEFSSLDCLRFCLFNFSPIESLVVSSLFTNSVDHIEIFLAKEYVQNEHETKVPQERLDKMKRNISRFILWNKKSKASTVDMMEFVMIEEMIDKVSVILVDKCSSEMPLKIVSDHKLEKKCNLSELSSLLCGLDHLLAPKIQWDLHVVLGLAAQEIIFDRLDSSQDDLTLIDVLRMVFVRPGLD